MQGHGRVFVLVHKCVCVCVIARVHVYRGPQESVRIFLSTLNALVKLKPEYALAARLIMYGPDHHTCTILLCKALTNMHKGHARCWNSVPSPQGS